MTSETLRVFVAIDIGDAVRAGLADELTILRRRWPRVKWMAPANVHLTLAFLGHIYPEQAANVGRFLAEIAPHAQPFELNVSGLGCFGPIRAPRVVWAGLAGVLEPLVTLQSVVADGLREMGFTPEDRPFAPHLTIGRVKAAGDAVGLGEWLRMPGDHAFGALRVDAIALMRSKLLPAGPAYTTLTRARLG